MFDVKEVRNDFPILASEVRGLPLIFLDSAASAQKPRSVIDAVKECYESEYANIHRGLYHLSEVATEKYEQVREDIRAFINAKESREIVFLRGATEAINLIASSWGGANLGVGDEIILTILEHHSNIVPWQMVAERSGAVIKLVPIDEKGELRLDIYEKLLSPKTKIVAITHASNVLGTIPPVEDMIRMAHKVGARVLVDGCQGIVHAPVDVQALRCDFYVFSGHKLYGPSGVGALYGRAELLEAMPPYQGGGEMIDRVSFENTTYAPIPHKFEAGTPSIANTIGLGVALEYIKKIGYEAIQAHETDLLTYATNRLREFNSVKICAEAENKTGILSFMIDGAHPHDVGTLLDQRGIAVRVGHHCAQPLMDFLGVSGTVRASFGLYNTREEVDSLCAGIAEINRIFH